MPNYPQQQGFPQQPGYPQQAGYPPQMGFPQQPGGAWAPPPQTGMGCGTKLLIVLGLLFLLMILVCCGGFFGLGYYVKHAVTQDSVAVKDITEDITEIEIPSPLEPAGAGRFASPVGGKLLALGAAYVDRQRDGILILIAAGDMFDEQTQLKIRQSLEQALQQGGVKKESREELQQRKESRKEMTIRGEKATFTIVQGVGAQSHEPRIQVQGVFQGEIGPVMLTLDANAERLPEDKVIKMLDSIK